MFFKSKTIIAILMAGTILSNGHASTFMKSDTVNGFIVEAISRQDYAFGKINIVKDDKYFRVNGRLSMRGKSFSGHTDMVIRNGKGEVLYKGSVMPIKKNSSHSRIKSVSTYSTYIFKYELPLAEMNPPQNSKITLNVHQEQRTQKQEFDCGKNNAL